MKLTGKTIKKTFATVVAIGVLTIGVAAFATEALTPAQIAAQVTGKTEAAVIAERATGKTYGTIAKDASQLDAFKTASLASKKAILDQQVKDGRITQAQADATYNAIVEAQKICDGTGTAQIGKTMGAGFGSGTGMNGRNGLKDGTGLGQGMGRGRATGGAGRGMGRGAGLGLNHEAQ
jgi:hypothetical protein